MRGMFNNIAFLELYRDLPVLWDRNNPDYKNRAARSEAETKMMELFEFDCARDLRNKIRSLRNTYNLELQRINNSVKNGADQDTVYTPKLIWFNLADSFLGKNVDENSQSWNETADNGHEFDEAPTEMAEASGMVAVKCEQPSRKRFKAREQKRKKRSYVSYEPGPSYQTSEEMMGANEFVVFGQHVAIQLEKLPIASAIRMQQEIQSILTKARLESIGQGGYEVQYVNEAEQDPISSDASS